MAISTFPTVSRERRAKVSCASRALEGRDWGWYVFSPVFCAPSTIFSRIGPTIVRDGPVGFDHG